LATDLHSVVIETLEAPLPVGTRVSSVVIETLEAPLPVGTRVSSVVIETLEDYGIVPSGGDLLPSGRVLSGIRMTKGRKFTGQRRKKRRGW
jgi:hypothetical protein